MPYRTHVLPTLTAAGTVAGSALGTVTSYAPIFGEIKGIFLDYGGTATTTDVVISAANFGGTILAVSNNVTNGWYYPTVQAHNGTAGTIDAYIWPPIADYVRAVLTQGSAGDTLDTTVLVEF